MDRITRDIQNRAFNVLYLGFTILNRNIENSTNRVYQLIMQITYCTQMLHIHSFVSKPHNSTLLNYVQEGQKIDGNTFLF